jgi:hypothetical protein
MKKESFTDLPLEELQSKEKTYKTAFLTSLILQILLGVLTIYLAIVKKQFAFIAIFRRFTIFDFYVSKPQKVQEELNKRI